MNKELPCENCGQYKENAFCCSVCAPIHFKNVGIGSNEGMAQHQSDPKPPPKCKHGISIKAICPKCGREGVPPIVTDDPSFAYREDSNGNVWYGTTCLNLGYSNPPTPTHSTQQSDPELVWITDLKCPACNKRGLFVGAGGYVTCSHLDCPNPDYEKALAAWKHNGEVAARIDELGGVKEHHDSIPLPWEVGTGPYIKGRIEQLTQEGES